SRAKIRVVSRKCQSRWHWAYATGPRREDLEKATKNLGVESVEYQPLPGAVWTATGRALRDRGKVCHDLAIDRSVEGCAKKPIDWLGEEACGGIQRNLWSRVSPTHPHRHDILYTVSYA
ncbi:MAG: hypothetical protein O2931_14565, partial [Planctomycetota bacterium]|nr:hypothetical protein [Planctomycetota bacterium]